MIDRIKIQKFKCLTNEDMEFKPLTILTGTNNSGKSSLLQSILLVAAAYNPINRNKMNTLISKYINLPARVELMVNKSWYTLPFMIDGKDYHSLLPFEDTLYFLSANRIGTEDVALLSDDIKVGYKGEYLFGSFYKYILMSRDESVDSMMCKIIPPGVMFDSILSYLRSIYNNLSIAAYNKQSGSSSDNLSPDDIEIFINRLKLDIDPLNIMINKFDISSKLNIWLSYITGTYNYLSVKKINSDKVQIAFIQDTGIEIDPFNIGDGTSYVSKIEGVN